MLKFGLLISAKGGNVGETLYFCGLILAQLIRLYYGRAHTTESKNPDRLGLGLVITTMWLLPALHIFTSLLQGTNYPSPSSFLPIGAAIFLASLTLRVKAHGDLGTNWSSRADTHKGQELVTTGIYGHIRHPIYASLWLWALAQSLLLPNYIAGPCALVAVLYITLHRIPHEERLLEEQFGETYRKYKDETYCLLPLVW